MQARNQVGSSIIYPMISMQDNKPLQIAITEITDVKKND